MEAHEDGVGGKVAGNLKLGNLSPPVENLLDFVVKTVPKWHHPLGKLTLDERIMGKSVGPLTKRRLELFPGTGLDFLEASLNGVTIRLGNRGRGSSTVSTTGNGSQKTIKSELAFLDRRGLLRLKHPSLEPAEAELTDGTGDWWSGNDGKFDGI